MYPLIPVDKRIPDGSIWQARRAYLLPAVDEWSRVYGPPGTRWSNPLGGWTTEHAGISVFHPERPFTISCHGPDGRKRFYVDVAHGVRVAPDLVEFVDLYLDVMVDADGRVSEKDEHQLVLLPRSLQAFARAARDDVRSLIRDAHPLFDPASRFYEVPVDASRLEPARDAIVLD